MLNGQLWKKKEMLWDKEIRYREHHYSHEKLESMRLVYDVIGDNCYKALVHHGITVDTFIDSITSNTNNHTSTVYGDRRIQAFIYEVCKYPNDIQMDKLSRGQLVFLRYSSCAAMGLLYYSLIGGFSAPKIVKVLDSTSYLTSHMDKTWRRLNETMSMVVDCIESDDAMLIGNNGWKSVIRVRLLHSRIRIHLLGSKSSQWDVNEYGYPINQEDMMGTLLSFSINILETISTIKGYVSRTDEDDYLHLWRYIGYLIGVSDNYNPCVSREIAGGAVESVVIHLLHPDRRSGEVARHVLRSVATRPPFGWSYTCHCEAARVLLGNSLSDALGIERGDIYTYLYVKYVFFVLKVISTCVSPWLISHDNYFIKKTKKIIRYQVNAAMSGTAGTHDHASIKSKSHHQS